MIISEPIIGKNIYLRSLSEQDVTPRYIQFLNDKEVNTYLETRHQIWSYDNTLEYVQSVNQSNDSILWGIFTRDNLHIGNIKIGPIHQRYKLSTVALFIGDKNYWGRGFAREAIWLVCSFCFDKLDLYKLSAGIYQDNLASFNVFKKLGFQVEGVLKDHYILKDDSRTDVFQLGLTKLQFSNS